MRLIKMGILTKKKPQKQVINTGTHLPEPSMSDYFELRQNRGKIVIKPILYQAKRDGNVLYGAFAVNQLVDKQSQRDTYDIDVYSKMPKKHAIELEKNIDRSVNADLAYVEQSEYPQGKKWKKIYRVKTKMNNVVEADYNTMPTDIKWVKRNGIKYETLERAEKKYDKMLKHPELGRGFNANMDMGRIKLYKRFKR